MNIPVSKRDEIRSQHFGNDQRCSRACWELYLKDYPSPIWQLVAYALYQTNHPEELEVVLKKYLKGEWYIQFIIINYLIKVLKYN